MTPSLFVIDNALPEHEFIRAAEYSKSADYQDHEYQGIKYSGLAPADPVDLRPLLENFFKMKVRIQLQYFRLGLAVESAPSRIHADTAVPAAWATVLYLNAPQECYGGTAFWKHKWLGLDRLPRETDQDVVDVVNGDGDKLEKWEMGTVVAMRTNRLIIYPTEYFHSRFPLNALGENADTGRRVHVSFFDLE